MIISKLKDIKNEGVNVCFIQGNRQVSNKNVKSKTTSIKEYGILAVSYTHLMQIDAKRRNRTV